MSDDGNDGDPSRRMQLNGKPHHVYSAFGLLLVVIGAGMIVMTIDVLRSVWTTRSWPVTAGRVVVSEPRDTALGYVNGKALGYLETAKVQHIEIEYTINGQMYRGQRYDDATSLRVRAMHRAQEAKDFPVGATVAVRYDPEDPRREVLSASYLVGAVAVAIAAMAFLGFGATLLVQHAPHIRLTTVARA